MFSAHGWWETLMTPPARVNSEHVFVQEGGRKSYWSDLSRLNDEFCTSVYTPVVSLLNSIYGNGMVWHHSAIHAMQLFQQVVFINSPDWFLLVTVCPVSHLHWICADVISAINLPLPWSHLSHFLQQLLGWFANRLQVWVKREKVGTLAHNSAQWSSGFGFSCEPGHRQDIWQNYARTLVAYRPRILMSAPVDQRGGGRGVSRDIYDEQMSWDQCQSLMKTRGGRV